MHIISGKYKGKRLLAPKKLPVRPTKDFAKEALFNILKNKIDFNEISVLDLFAGTGNISFEFASRSTQEITSVDAYYGCVKYIQKIAEELSFPIKTVKADVVKYIASTDSSFDIIFADPPYNYEIHLFEKFIAIIFQNNLLKTNGFLIVEHSKHTDLSMASNFRESRRYGGTVFSFFE